MIIRHSSFGDTVIQCMDDTGMIGLGPGMSYALRPGRNYRIISRLTNLDLEMQIHTCPEGQLFLHSFRLTNPKKEEGADTRSVRTCLLSALERLVSQLSGEVSGS